MDVQIMPKGEGDDYDFRAERALGLDGPLYTKARQELDPGKADEAKVAGGGILIDALSTNIIISIELAARDQSEIVKITPYAAAIVDLLLQEEGATPGSVKDSLISTNKRTVAFEIARPIFEKTAPVIDGKQDARIWVAEADKILAAGDFGDRAGEIQIFEEVIDGIISLLSGLPPLPRVHAAEPRGVDAAGAEHPGP